MLVIIIPRGLAKTKNVCKILYNVKQVLNLHAYINIKKLCG